VAAADSLSAAAASFSIEGSDDETTRYIKESLNAGQSQEDVKNALVDAGHDPADVGAMMNNITAAGQADNTGEAGQQIDGQQGVVEQTAAYGESAETVSNETAGYEAGAQQPDAEIIQYITDSFNAGQTAELTRQALINAGHDPAEVDQIMNSYQQSAQMQPGAEMQQGAIDQTGQGDAAATEDDPELVEYINKCFAEGLSVSQTVDLLVKAGHDKSEMKVLVKKINKGK